VTWFQQSVSSRNGHAPASIDLDVHGIVGLRLENALPEDVAIVERQIGRFQVPSLERAPDIRVRFVSTLPAKDLRYARYPYTAFNEEGFFLLDPKSGKKKARVDLGTIGGECEILCRHGSGPVPFLMSIVVMSALFRGFVPLHGSAFAHDGVGVIVTGWAKGGKTEALLSFAEHGASYVGDEWILIDRLGAAVFGVPEEIRLWEWHVRQLPRIQQYLRREHRVRFALIHLYEWFISCIPEAIHRNGVVEALHKALPVLQRQLFIKLTPEQLFGRNTVPALSPQKLFWMCSRQDPTIEVVRADASEIAQRMAASVTCELLPLISGYCEFAFAFPHKQNKDVEGYAALVRDRLVHALTGMDAYVVNHPYPICFEELYCAMLPYLASSSSSVSNLSTPLAGESSHEMANRIA
jgi:hypothetical protein